MEASRAAAVVGVAATVRKAPRAMVLCGWACLCNYVLQCGDKHRSRMGMPLTAEWVWYWHTQCFLVCHLGPAAKPLSQGMF